MKTVFLKDVLQNSVFQNFANFTGKQHRWSLFLTKLQAQACNFIKKRFRHRYFPTKFDKFLRTPFFAKQVQRQVCLQHGVISPWLQ